MKAIKFSVLAVLMFVGLLAHSQTYKVTAEVACGTLQYSIAGGQWQGYVGCTNVLPAGSVAISYQPIWGKTVYPPWPGYNHLVIDGQYAFVTGFNRVPVAALDDEGRSQFIDSLTFVFPSTDPISGNPQRAGYGSAVVTLDAWKFPRATKSNWDIEPGSVFNVTYTSD